MRYFIYIFIIQIALLQSNSLTLYVSQAYVVPEPEFEVFSSGGFTASIPHEDGIQVFSFHGNVNKTMCNFEEGQLSNDVLTEKNNSWVFENNQTVLKKGDVVYFWILVIKNNMGYRYDDGQYIVKDIVEKQPQNRSHASSVQPTTQSNSDDKIRTPIYSPICEVALNLSNTVDHLTGDIKTLQEVNDILKNIIAKDDNLSRNLRFTGILPPFDDAQYTVQIILQQKLGVHIPVENVRRESDSSILFQVPSLQDKIYVIGVAKNKLKKIRSKISLEY